jgi:hypothetical protein
MYIVLAVILIVAAVVVGWYDTYSAQRTYADVYASRYGHIPPLADWFFKRDADPEVERYRRLHRNLWLLVTGLAVAGILAVLFGANQPV